MTKEQKNELLKLKELLKNQENSTDYIAYIKDRHSFVTKDYIKDNFLEDYNNRYYKQHPEEITQEILDDWHCNQTGSYSEQWLNYDEIEVFINEALNEEVSIEELNSNIELYWILSWFKLNTDLFDDEI